MPAMSQVASDADRERVRDVVREVVYPADRRLLDALTGPVPRGHARAARARLGARTATRCTGTRSGAGRRSTWSPRRSTRSGLDELATINEERRAIAGSEGFGTRHRGLPAQARRSTTTNQAPSPEALVARCNEDIVPGRRGRAADVRAPAGGRLRGPAGRGVQGEATRRSPTTSRRRSTSRGPASTTSTPTTCRAGRSRSSPRRPTTRRSRATTSRSASRWSTRASTCSGGSAPAPPAARTSRAGACTRSAWPTSSGCTGRTPSGSGCSTPRRGARRGWSSTPGCTRWAGRASSRSTGCSTPASRTPTR